MEEEEVADKSILSHFLSKLYECCYSELLNSFHFPPQRWLYFSACSALGSFEMKDTVEMKVAIVAFTFYIIHFSLGK